MRNSKSKKIKKVNAKTLIVAVDIGKKIHHGYFRAPNGNDITPFCFYNFRKGFEQFWWKVCRFKKEQGLKKIIIGFESSGPYAEPLFHFLKNRPARLVQINPMHTKRLKELTGNSPNKTDKKDPRVIADVISLGHSLTVVVPEGPAAELRRLTQARERAIKIRTAIMNQLQDLVFVVFPEFVHIMQNISSKSAVYLVQHHTTPESIVNLGIESLTAILKKVSRGKLGQERAKALFEAAQKSIGIDGGKQSIVLEIAHLISHIEKQSQFIDKLEQEMGYYLQQIPYSRICFPSRVLATSQWLV